MTEARSRERQGRGAPAVKRYRKLKTVVIYRRRCRIANLTLFPLFYAVASSLRSDTEIFQYAMPFTLRTLLPVRPTGNAYREIFLKYEFYRPVFNTVVVSAAAILFGCLINSVAAYGFACYEFRFQKPLYALVLFSFMIPFESITIPLYTVVDGLGWVDTFAGIVVPSIADGLVLFLFTQFFSDFPQSLFEAARVDGATWADSFFRILVPLSVPVFITASLMIFMTHWNSYLWPLLIARSPDIRLIQVALSDFRGAHTTEWSNLYAASTVSALLPLLLFFPFQKYFVQGITSSGIKG